LTAREIITPVDSEQDNRWYAVRSLFSHPEASETAYEERITLWQAADLDEALVRAEAEAVEYAEFAGVSYLSGFGQSYALADAPPRDGAEVFSLTRTSALPPRPYIEQFFDTGRERQS
jgi:hypothetical protein